MKANFDLLTQLTGKTYRTIKRRLENIKPVSEDSTGIFYDSVIALPLIYARQSGKGQDGEKIDIGHEHGRLAKEKADAQELKNKVARQEMLPVDLLANSLSDLVEQVNAIFESIPLQAKKADPTLSATAINVIKKEVVKAKNAASKVKVDFTKLSD